MRPTQICLAIMVALAALLLVSGTFPNAIQQVYAESLDTSWATVKPTNTSNGTLYTNAGSNWTFAFEARWSFGNNIGQYISNATVTIQVDSTLQGKTVNRLTQNTTLGVFTFNYSSSTADILTFTPIQIVTQDGIQHNSTSLQKEAFNAIGLKSGSVTVWWDNFHVALANINTDALGRTALSVNVTYLLIPEEGLALQPENAFKNQTFLPKTVHDAEVTVNGVRAEESSEAGIYTANVSTWLSTAYILVRVSQPEWITTDTGFSFVHAANNPIWTYGGVIVAALISAATALRLFVFFKKRKEEEQVWHRTFPFLGGILLASASAFSFYWTLVAIDGILSGFSWTLLAVLEVFSLAFGFFCATRSMKCKNQALVLFAATLSLLVNSVAIKLAFDYYQLVSSWFMIGVAFWFSLLSGLFVSGADELFDVANV